MKNLLLLYRPTLHSFMFNPFINLRPYVSLDDDLDPTANYEVRVGLPCVTELRAFDVCFLSGPS